MIISTTVSSRQLQCQFNRLARRRRASLRINPAELDLVKHSEAELDRTHRSTDWIRSWPIPAGPGAVYVTVCNVSGILLVPQHHPLVEWATWGWVVRKWWRRVHLKPTYPLFPLISPVLEGVLLGYVGGPASSWRPTYGWEKMGEEGVGREYECPQQRRG
eukprot:764056-Hanusia_phi.AAC.1